MRATQRPSQESVPLQTARAAAAMFGDLLAASIIGRSDTALSPRDHASLMAAASADIAGGRARRDAASRAGALPRSSRADAARSPTAGRASARPPRGRREDAAKHEAKAKATSAAAGPMPGAAEKSAL